MVEKFACRSILVIYVSRIGDTMLITPAIRAIARAWPGARTTFLGHPKRAEVMRHLPFVHRVGRITKQLAVLRGRLLPTRYDLAFVYGYDRALIEFALRVARRVVAFRQEDEDLNRRLYRVAAAHGPDVRHSVHHFLQLIVPLEITPAGFHLSYEVAERERQWAAGKLRSILERGASPLVGLQVASFPTKGFRDWPLAHFIGLCEKILAHHPRAHFLIFGGKHRLEAERTQQLHQRFARYSTLYAGRLSLRQTAALMERLDVYVGVDTGPTHIMGSLHRPLVALYHPISPSRVLGALDHPCFFPVDHPLADCGATPETPMADISVDAVWRQVEAALGWRMSSATRATVE